jgi:dTDP-4-amino-4,6-dideoxygalactose transaminase
MQSAILPVHLFGQSADWIGLRPHWQCSADLKLIEDAAQAWGAEYQGVKAGGL